MKIKKGDTVQVITGNDAGKSGRVIKVFLNKDRVVVEGVNIVKKHARPTRVGLPLTTNIIFEI